MSSNPATADAVTSPVVIVGAGPTGVTSAILLAQLGVPVVVLDRWADVYPQPRAVHLDDEVFTILDRLGVAAEFTAISRPALGLRLLDRDLRVLAEIDRGGLAPSSGYPRANMFDQPVLERVLRARMHELPLVDFRGDVIVTDVAEVGDGYAVSYTDRTTGTGQTVGARFVLGCDGANSIVRQAVGATMQDLRFEQRWLVIDVTSEKTLDQWEGVHQVCDSGRAATYMRVGADRYRWEFQLRDGESAADYATLDDVAPLIEPWTTESDTSGFELVRVAEYTFRAMIADRWRREGLFLLGDAAHLTPPFIGQGMGAGLRDSMNLAWKLAGVLQGRLPEDVLDSYEPERKQHVDTIIRLAKLTGVVMTSGGRVGNALRRYLAPAALAVPRARRRIADSETAPLTRSDWINARRRDRLAGRLAPYATISRLNGGWSTDQPFRLITTTELSYPVRHALEARGCRVIRVEASSPAGTWLGGGRARAALVRPDGTVLMSAQTPSLVVNEAFRRFAC
ncbi:bifunctional 3-(3-hydroxy-phenyl)propionate/3-hydroxycinnamic acid hydroxylase [Nocardioides jiangxiensis]|uniref:Bifunctional 3-(3-hydroxy-phenyl)propionate/3-hydroxycinnamic acid hydroxylase n=1 Tax=Nocardioides jiangxiensis TaxID=3064524 RepID=A0ABT9B0V4_9ACTN|nr:bifunctional 3-(3-hydroxy-phenyl)propionate/3-hydroxycinnamic acid hydroxylase [Nocardioides sp. WY-20]MDO7867257.1 bifunctional 3-(3-hydroxy-phenyl)propionate/3-hydroxycinnamic acid hydroxylase [Nocardioides sp. WY-20]